MPMPSFRSLFLKGIIGSYLFPECGKRQFSETDESDDVSLDAAAVPTANKRPRIQPNTTPTASTEPEKQGEPMDCDDGEILKSEASQLNPASEDGTTVAPAEIAQDGKPPATEDVSEKEDKQVPTEIIARVTVSVPQAPNQYDSAAEGSVLTVPKPSSFPRESPEIEDDLIDSPPRAENNSAEASPEHVGNSAVQVVETESVASEEESAMDVEPTGLPLVSPAKDHSQAEEEDLLASEPEAAVQESEAVEAEIAAEPFSSSPKDEPADSPTAFASAKYKCPHCEVFSAGYDDVLAHMVHCPSKKNPYLKPKKLTAEDFNVINECEEDGKFMEKQQDAEPFHGEGSTVSAEDADGMSVEIESAPADKEQQVFTTACSYCKAELSAEKETVLYSRMKAHMSRCAAKVGDSDDEPVVVGSYKNPAVKVEYGKKNPPEADEPGTDAGVESFAFSCPHCEKISTSDNIHIAYYDMRAHMDDCTAPKGKGDRPVQVLE